MSRTTVTEPRQLVSGAKISSAYPSVGAREDLVRRSEDLIQCSGHGLRRPTPCANCRLKLLVTLKLWA
jgi:hypothetical protein